MSQVRTAACFLLLLVGAGCDAPAQLTVDVRTDWKPFIDFDAVRTELSPVPFEGASPSDLRSVMTSVEASDDFLGGRRVAELDGVPLGRDFVRVTLLDLRGDPVAQRVVDLKLEASFALTVVMTRNCRDVVCPGPGDAAELTACLDGRCVDPRCTTSSPEHCGTPTCATDADCGARCETGVCAAGICLCDDGPPVLEDGGGACPEGMGCDDGDACTTDDTCSAGTCTGTAVDCDDGNACTDDTCDAASGCVHTDNTAGCDDGDACTTGDACAGGSCVGTAVSCDDGNPCTDDACDPGSGCRNTSRPEHSTCGAANMRCCGGSCVNIRTDPNHCSGCGQACATGRACIIYDGEPACDCVANSECHGGVGQLCSTVYDYTCACTANSGCVEGQTCIDRPTTTNHCTY